jgi:hypothetical protein
VQIKAAIRQLYHHAVSTGVEKLVVEVRSASSVEGIWSSAFERINPASTRVRARLGVRAHIHRSLRRRGLFFCSGGTDLSGLKPLVGIEKAVRELEMGNGS